MSDGDRHLLDPCGCCEPSSPPAPAAIWNRPALPAVGYRVGTWASFRRTMLDAVAGRPELRAWTTRRSDDYGIALCEMWAYLADVLTFYHERAMNEAYLRTALHRDSVLRLAALLGYQLGPGVAATADLVFTLAKERTLQIPAGLRVGSVPGEGEKPQKFETEGTLAAEARLNRVRIYPEPVRRDPLAEGSTWGFLSSEASASEVSIGDQWVVFREGKESIPGSPVVEEKEILAVDEKAGKREITWAPHLTSSYARAWRFHRKFRLFGASAPSSYPVLDPPDTPVRLVLVDNYSSFLSFYLDDSPGDSFFLERVVDDLKVGTKLLIVIKPRHEDIFRGGNGDSGPAFFDSFVKLVEVKKVSTFSAVFPPLEGLASRVTLEAPVFPDFEFDIRCVSIYELVDDEISFFDIDYAEMLPDGVVYATLDDLTDIEPGRTVILDDKDLRPQTVTIGQAWTVDADGDDIADHLAIPFDPPLDRDLDAATAVAYGNVARATHGETVAGEVLGSGDASASFQRFELRKSPVTHVPAADAPGGAASTLEVRVDNVLWHERDVLFDEAPDARVYTTRIADDGTMTVQLGDGETGARLPSGRHNVVASYRQGLGLAGRVAARSLTKLLDRPKGLKAVINPAAAFGGADPETLDAARENAPNTVRTFDRAVSLRDFEDLAREYQGIAKARAAWQWEGEQRVVRLTVACDAGAALGDEMKRDLVAYLDRRRDPHRQMRVADYQPVSIYLAARLGVHPDHLPEAVRETAESALLGAFSFDRRRLGEGVHLSDVYQILHQVEGLVAADIDIFVIKPPSFELTLRANFAVLWRELFAFLAAWESEGGVREDLRRRGLRFSEPAPELVQPRLLLYPHELIRIETPATDLGLGAGRAPS